MMELGFTRLVVGAAMAGAMALTAGAARAGDGSVFPPNYRFPAGTTGFKLVTLGGPANPGILVGFNPQPEPPGDVGVAAFGDGSVFPQTMLSLRDPLRPTLENPFEGAAWSLQFWIVGHGDGGIEPPEPERDGPIGFRHVLDGHVFDITFFLGPNQIDPASWVGFDPQPDPPGTGFGVNFSFTEAADPFFAFSIKLDGAPLSFDVASGGIPEPATWSLMILGFAAAGAGVRRRRARAAT
jgi:hypothetical protein